MNQRTLWLALITLALASKSVAADKPTESVSARIDRLFAEWNTTNSPGFGLAISRNGALVYEHGYGMANLELGVPITPASVFPAASISKQFTAMSILLLAQRHALSLDDEVKKFIPEWAYTEQRITIRHLLTHTSGLRDAFSLLGLAAPREDGVNVNDAIASALARQRGLNFAPGTEFQYNNGAYNLLGTIVKRVSGQSLRDFADTNIFKPLGMSHTHFHDDPAMLVPNRVSGYSRGESGFRLARPEGGIVGNAGLFTTARDLLRWEQNFADARVGSRILSAEMQKPAVATDWGDGSFYGFGLIISEYRGLRMIGHGGGDSGISTHVARFPDQDLAVAVLGNLDNVNPLSLVRGVADIFLADKFPSSSITNPVPNLATVPPTPQQLASFAGLYRDPTTEFLGRFFIRDGKLMASADAGEENFVEMIPLGANRFGIPNSAIVVEFIPATKGGVQEAHVTGAGPKAKISQRLEPFAVKASDLTAFAAAYTSSEMAATYKIRARDSELVLQLPQRGDVLLRPVFKDAFAGPSAGIIIKFSRDRRGKVTGFTMHSSGIRALHFQRQA